jgi:hypothetical protein
MPGQVQTLNDEQMTLLSSRLQDRYEPNFAWGNVGSFYSILPALRAFWPCGPQIVTAQSLLIADTANNFHLTAAHSPLFGYESLIQYVDFDGVNDYATYADNAQFDILATEAYNVYPGLTMGCWIYPDRAVGTNEHLLSKFGAAFKSYALVRLAAGNAVFVIYDAAAAGVSATSTSLVRQSYWQFVCGRFVPATSIDAYLSTGIGTLEKTSTATALNNIRNTAVNFTMASTADPLLFFDGKISLAFISASALSDTMINALYQLSRPLFGQ